MKNEVIILGIAFFVSIFIILIIIKVMKSRKKKELKKIIDNLEYEKNQLATASVGPELAKVETYTKNDKLEVMYENWQERLKDIKEIRIPKITDMLIEAEYSLSKKDYKNTMYKIAKLEMEIYKVRTKSDFLLKEIKELTTSETRNRAIITKLKARYRSLYENFDENRNSYADMENPVSLQFENISKRFEDFEIIMDANKFTEVSIVVNAIEQMLKHMEVVIEELPSIVLMAENVLPKKMLEIEKVYNKMKSEGYPLDYLNVEFNINEAQNKIVDILDRAKTLNLEDSLFDLKVLTEYFENLFIDFEKEKLIKVDYEEASETLYNKLEKTNELVSEIFEQLDELKATYNLKAEDINNLFYVRKKLEKLNSDYKNLIDHTGNNSFPYSKLTEEIEILVVDLAEIENRLDISLNVLGSMHDDEQRARQQLDEVQNVLRKAQDSIRTYNLPVIPNSYFVELKEAHDAVREIVKELSKKPITIETLNTRVDTARDLSLKLLCKTKDMIKMAMFSELSIVYGNRFRSSEKEIDKALVYSEILFNKGEYRRSLEMSINALNKIEPGIYDKLVNLYGNEDFD